jgi:hypothetical protein
MRKTIRLADIKMDINEQLSAEYTSEKERNLLGMLLEKWLMNRGAYQGFRWLEKDRVPKGCKAGINTLSTQTSNGKTVNELFDDTDSSRKYYY